MAAKPSRPMWACETREPFHVVRAFSRVMPGSCAPMQEQNTPELQIHQSSETETKRIVPHRAMRPGNGCIVDCRFGQFGPSYGIRPGPMHAQ